MKHDWILDVLTDLRTFSRENDLLTLAAQLEDTQMVAAIEIASVNERCTFDAAEQDKSDRLDLYTLGQSKRDI
jgi:hypothetical protein